MVRYKIWGGPEFVLTGTCMLLVTAAPCFLFFFPSFSVHAGRGHAAVRAAGSLVHDGQAQGSARSPPHRPPCPDPTNSRGSRRLGSFFCRLGIPPISLSHRQVEQKKYEKTLPLPPLGQLHHQLVPAARRASDTRAQPQPPRPSPQAICHLASPTHSPDGYPASSQGRGWGC